MHAPTRADTTDDDALLVSAWVVPDGTQDDFVKRIEGLLEHLSTLDGFKEGAVLRGVNPTRFVSYVRLRSAQDRREIFDDARVSARLREIEALARADVHSYDVLRAFRPSFV